MDLIDRQAAIAYAISGRVRTLPTTEDGENWIRTAEVRQNLLTMPSAQSERKKGAWKNGYCSECGYNWGKVAPLARVPNFCPGCGAIMK